MSLYSIRFNQLLFYSLYRSFLVELLELKTTNAVFIVKSDV